MSSIDVHDIIREASWFNGLPGGDLAKISQLARVENYRKKDFIYMPGEVRKNLYCVLEGTLQLSLIDGSGSQFILSSMRHGEWFGEASVVGPMPLLEARAATDCKLLMLPYSEINKCVDQAIFHRNLFSDHIKKVQLVYQLLAGMLFLPLKARLAARFLFLVDSFGHETENGIVLDMKLSQQDFAKMGMGSRQRVNKIFREWQAKGIYEKVTGKYLIKDIEALKLETHNQEDNV